MRPSFESYQVWNCGSQLIIGSLFSPIIIFKVVFELQRAPLKVPEELAELRALIYRSCSIEVHDTGTH